MAQDRIPEEIMSAIRCGRMIALQKPEGGVHGIVSASRFQKGSGQDICSAIRCEGESGDSASPACPEDEGRLRDCLPPTFFKS